MVERFEGIIKGRGVTGEHLDSIRLSGFLGKLSEEVGGIVDGGLPSDPDNHKRAVRELRLVFCDAMSAIEPEIIFGGKMDALLPVCYSDGLAGDQKSVRGETVWFGNDGFLYLQQVGSWPPCKLKDTDPSWFDLAPKVVGVIAQRVRMAEQAQYGFAGVNG